VRQPASDDTQSQKKEGVCPLGMRHIESASNCQCQQPRDSTNLGDVKRPFIYQGKIDGKGVCPLGMRHIESASTCQCQQPRDSTKLGGVVQERDRRSWFVEREERDTVGTSIGGILYDWISAHYSLARRVFVKNLLKQVSDSS
jgi:hypothetical protein